MSEYTTLLPGISEFKTYIDEDGLFVDKSLFIQDFMNLGAPISVFLRPRRFGKSTNLSLLKNFFQIGADKTLFEKFLIGQDTAFVEAHCGKYPVVYLSLKDTKGPNWTTMYSKIWRSLRETVLVHHADLGGDIGTASCYNFMSIEPPAIFEDVLKQLMMSLHRKYGKQVLVLIDEYDAPLNHAYLKGYYEEASSFFNEFYSAAFKDSGTLKKACLMGIMEIRGAGYGSGFNNASYFTAVDGKFSQYFGFSKTEIKKYCSTEELNIVLKWYNGYTMGKHRLINPWSFIQWLESKETICYWTGTGDVNDLSMQLSESYDEVFYQGLEMTFLDSKTSIETFSTSINYSVRPLHMRDIWNKLINTGYLSFEPSVDNRNKGFAVIPNHELRYYWQEELMMLLDSKIGKKILPELLVSLQILQSDRLESTFEHALMATSFHDFQKESSYHLMCGTILLIATIGHPNIVVRSNREARHGRYDVIVDFRDFKKAVVIEFKLSKSEDKLDHYAELALQQIITKGYAEEFDGYECLLIGVAFFRQRMSDFKTKIITIESELQ